MIDQIKNIQSSSLSLLPYPNPNLNKVQKNSSASSLTLFNSNPSKINMGPPKNEWDGSWKIEKRFYTRLNVTDFYSSENSISTVTNVTLKNGERLLLDIRKTNFNFFSSCKKFQNNISIYFSHLSVTFILVCDYL